MNTNLFGTDGIRATIGKSPCTQDELICLGYAVALWAQKKYKKSHPHIMVAHDTRISCGWMKACLSIGLLRHQCKVYDAAVLPTPAALVLMQEYSLLTTIDCALVISASHNPFQDNGIKLIDISGKISLADEHEITRLFNEQRAQAHPFDPRALGKAVTFDNAESLYCAKIASYCSPDFLRGLTVVLDCANGATYRTAPRIFKKLGAEVITINHQPNGYNINEKCGSTHPEHLQHMVVACNADIGCAFDGDGDRLILVNRQGQIKDGDDCLAILAAHPTYRSVDTVVGTLMTNYGLEKHFNGLNKKLIRTQVGDKYVMQALKEQQSVLGGEPSGHLICGDALMAGDGVLAALRCIESILHTKNPDLTSFDRTPSKLINIRVSHKPDISQEPYASCIHTCEQLAQPGRILIRYSGTEPILRVLVETPEHQTLEDISDILEKKLIPLLLSKE